MHDSVLQTLALVQRHADEPRRVASLARRQERELRSWLYGDGATPGDTLEGALAAAADEIEELHGVRVELASGGDCELTDDVRAVVLAAREAMANAAKFSGADEISVYAEADDERRQRLRPRPRRRLRPRRGARRPARPGGVDRGPDGARRAARPSIASTPGEGTEVELTLPPRGARHDACASCWSTTTSSSARACAASSARRSRSSARPARSPTAVPLIKETDPDVVLLDVHLPDGGGEAVIAGVSVERPGVKFLALSVSDAAEDVIGVIRAGARGYVTKTISADELADAVLRVSPTATPCSRRASRASCSTRSARASACTRTPSSTS